MANKKENAIIHQIDPWSEQRSFELLASRSKCDSKDLPHEARLVAQECGGLPLALAMVGARARGDSGNWSDLLTRFKQAELSKIVQSVLNYPERNLWRAMDACVEALEKDGTLERYLDFAVFEDRAQIPLEALITFWRSYGYSAIDVKELVARFEDLCLAQRKNDVVTLHDLQHDYLRERTRETAQQRHAALVASYRVVATAGWISLPDDGYFRRALTFHLERAGLDEELHTLLAPDSRSRELTWYEAMHQAGLVFQYRQDIERGFGRAAISFANKQTAKSIQQLIYYTLVKSSLHSFAELLSPELPALLVDAGLWTSSTAVQYLKNRLIPDDAVNGYLAIAEITSQGTERDVLVTLAAACVTRGLSSAQTLLPAICRLASPPLRDDLTDLLRHVADPGERVLAGAALLPLVSRSKADELANALLKLYDSLSPEYLASRSDNWWRQKILTGFSLNATREDAVRDFEIRVLQSIAPFLAPELRDAASLKAFCKADAMSHPEPRVQARTILLPLLQAQEIRPVFHRWLADATPDVAPIVIVHLIATAVEAGLDQQTAETAANSIEEVCFRLISLATIKRLLRQELAAEQIDQVFEYLGTPEKELKLGLVLAVIPVLPMDAAERLFRIVMSFPNFHDLLAVIRATEITHLFSSSQLHELAMLAQAKASPTRDYPSWRRLCWTFDAFSGQARIQWLVADRKYYMAVLQGNVKDSLELCKNLPSSLRASLTAQMYDCCHYPDQLAFLCFRFALLTLFFPGESPIRLSDLIREIDTFDSAGEQAWLFGSAAEVGTSDERIRYLERALDVIKDDQLQTLCIGVEIARKLPDRQLQDHVQWLIARYRQGADDVDSFSHPVSLSWTNLRRLAEITTILCDEAASALASDVSLLLRRVQSNIGSGQYMTVWAALARHWKGDRGGWIEECLTKSSASGAEKFIALLTALETVYAAERREIISGVKRAVPLVRCSHCQQLFTAAAAVYEELSLESKLTHVLSIKEDYLFVLCMKALRNVCDVASSPSNSTVQLLRELSERPRHVALEVLSMWVPAFGNILKDGTAHTLYAWCDDVALMHA